MPRADPASPTWLSLHEAAKRLDIHPATLRDWADKGRIRSVRTPGGHRRFSEADVDAVGAHRAPDLSLFMDATVGHARLATSAGQLAAEPWYSRFDEAAKDRQRQLGQDLMRLLVAYLADTEKSFTSDILAIGRRYADLTRAAGLSLSDALRAFHLFEGIVRSSVDQMVAAHVAGPRDLDRQVGWFLNEVRVAMVESFSEVG